MEELFSKIAKANDEIETIELKGKQYCEVKERVIAFRKVYPNGTINTLIEHTENYIECEAIILDETGKTIARGHSRELANKPFSLENCETSAIGRALGFCGFGIKTSIASKEDMDNLESPSGLFDEEIPNERRNAQIKKLKSLSADLRAEFLNFYHYKKFEDAKTDEIEGFLIAKGIF